MTKVIHGNKMKKKCPQCGTEVLVTITKTVPEMDHRETTPPENHSPVCRGKKMLKKRPQWPMRFK